MLPTKSSTVIRIIFRWFFSVFFSVCESLRTTAPSHSPKINTVYTTVLSLALLLRQLAGLGLLQLGDARQTLGAQQTTAPVATDLVLALVVVHLDGVHDLREVGAVGDVHLRQGDGRAGLAADQQSQARLALDDAVWHAHFAAQGGQEEDNLGRGGKEIHSQ